MRRGSVLGLAVFVLACGRDPSEQPWPTSTGEMEDTTGGASSMPTQESSDATTSPTDPGTEESGESSTGDPEDDPGDPWEPVPDYEPLADAALADLQGTLDAILSAGAVSSAMQGVLVVDLETEQVLYERNPDDVIVPASNTKMFTTASSIDLFGEDHRMLTEVVADAAPDGSGVVNGDLHLVGDHDFTWSTFFYPSARFPLDRIAEQLYADGLRTVTGSAIARGEFCYEGQSLGTYNVVNHRATAAARFGDALTAAGITVAGGTGSSPDFDPPAGGESLLTWASPPLSGASVHVNGPSHNEFADILLRHIGWHTAGTSTYEAGGTEMRDWMESIPTDVTNVQWNDGSGLSHGNRVSPRNVIDLVRFATTTPTGEAFLRSLAISGVRGTIGSRMTGADTWGRVFAKTGTLPSIGTVSLSGVLYHRYDGRRIAFSVLFNGAFNIDGARSVQNQVVEALAVDLRGVAPRPASPTLASVVNEEGSTVVRVTWDEIPEADGYALWLSEDGKTFDIADARYVQSAEYRAGQLPFSPVYMRVTAVAEVPGGPAHSVPTDVYGAASSFEPSTVLIVDGNDRWQATPQPENPRTLGHDFALAHGAAMEDAGFDIVANDAVIDGSIDLTAYDAVVWTLGEEGDADRSFDDVEQSIVSDYLEGGGALMVSGAELGYDLVELGTPQDAAFMTDVLRAGYVADDAGTVVLGRGTGPLAGVPTLQFLTPGDQLVTTPDLLDAVNGSSPILDYVGGVGPTAGVAYEGDTRVLVFGFPFEAIDNATDRADVMQRALSFLLGA